MRKRGRDVHGILLFDKPVGLSSNHALQRVRRLYGARKAGHTGNLDVLASGLLPVCFGEATKVTPYLLGADKRYLSTIQLGSRTTTGDAEGEVIETKPVGALDKVRVEAVLNGFLGVIEQTPPMYSALKHEGQRLYRLAVQGIEVPRKPRPVTIHAIALHALSGERLEIEVSCSKGTYIRTLAEDIGTALGTVAYVAALRRLGVDPFRIEDSHALAELEILAGQGAAALDAVLLPLDAPLNHLPAVALSETTAYYLLKGQPVWVNDSPKGLLRLYDAERRFLGIGEALGDGRVAPRRLLNLP